MTHNNLLAARMSDIKESPTIAMMTKAQYMQQQGQDVVILAAGEPDFATPRHIKDAAIRAINADYSKYTPVSGTRELKEAIVAKFKKENNLNYQVKQVLVSCGAKHSIYNAFQALINPHDEVLIPAPYWVSYPDMAILAGGIPKYIKCGSDTKYKLTKELLTQAITTKTKVLVMNSPSNPTGMVYTEAELMMIADVLRQHQQIYVVSDDIYEHIIFPGTKFITLLNVAPDLFERVVVVNGVSKAYAMTGWRIGFAACGNSEVIKAMDTIQSQVTSCPCSISQQAAYTALISGLDCVKPMQDAFYQRHEYVLKRLNSIPGIICLPAQGAFYAFFNCKKAQDILIKDGKLTENSDFAFANYLLENYLIAGVPGSSFGLEDHIRISFATSIQELEKGLDRIAAALA